MSSPPPKRERTLPSRQHAQTHQSKAPAIAVKGRRPQRNSPLPERKLATEFIQRHRGGGGGVVAVGQAVDGNFDDSVEQGQNLLIESQSFIPDHQHALAL